MLAALHGQSFARPWSAEAFADLLATPGVFGLRAAEGFILCRAVAGEAEILTLAVAPAAQRAGLGRSLVAAAAELAALAGAEAMFLEVAEDNTAALALYGKAGFEPSGRRRGYYPRGDGSAADALVMRRALNSAGPAAYVGDA